jgi:hypothetical protein
MHIPWRDPTNEKTKARCDQPSTLTGWTRPMDVLSIFLMKANNSFTEADYLISPTRGPFGVTEARLVPSPMFGPFFDDLKVTVIRPANEWRASLFDCFNSTGVLDGAIRPFFQNNIGVAINTPLFAGWTMAGTAPTFGAPENAWPGLMVKESTPMACVNIEFEQTIGGPCVGTYKIIAHLWIYFDATVALQPIVYDRDITVLDQTFPAAQRGFCTNPIRQEILNKISTQDIHLLLAPSIFNWLSNRGLRRKFAEAYILPGYRDLYRHFGLFPDAARGPGVDPKFSELSLAPAIRTVSRSASLCMAPVPRLSDQPLIQNIPVLE